MIKLFNKKTIPRLARKIKRKRKIRAKIQGSADKPRLTLYKSNKNIFVQVIDDEKQITLASISSIEKGIERKNVTVELAIKFSEMFAQRLKEKNISTLVFDRNGYKFHGIVKSFVDTLRANGIII